MLEVTLSGSPEEIGRERAEKLSSSILLGMEHWLSSHKGGFTQKERRAWGRKLAGDLKSRAPELLAEIISEAHALNVPEEELFAFNFRAWNAFSEHPSVMACYNVSFRDPKRGVLLAGVVEDAPFFYHLEATRPKKNLAFYAINWAGMVWAIRGMNERGLAVGQVSAFPGRRLVANPSMRFGTDDYARGYFALRYALEHAERAEDAAKIVSQWPCTSNFMFADAKGRVVVLEKAVNRHALRRSKRKDGLLIGGGHYTTRELLAGLISSGIYPSPAEASLRRERWVEKFLNHKARRFSLEGAKEMLKSHDGDGNFCNDGTQAATIAVPAKGEFHVAPYRPCTSGFKRYLTSDLRKGDGE